MKRVAQPKLHRSQLLRELKREYPELKERLNQWYGLLHVEVGEFARFTQEHIDQRNEQDLQRCFEIADRYLADGNGSMKNALTVSYLEHLKFEDGRVERSWARKVMPKRLEQELEELEVYLERLFRSDG